MYYIFALNQKRLTQQARLGIKVGLSYNL